MRLAFWRFVRATGLLMIASLVNYSACATPPPEPLPVEDSAVCDPKKDECVLVKRGFLIGRLNDAEKIVRLQAALKLCQQRP